MGGASSTPDDQQTKSNSGAAYEPVATEDDENELDRFLKKPIMPFVLLAAWLGVLDMACCTYTILSQDLSDCHFEQPFAKSVGLHNWLVVQIGFSALDVLFAPYLQYEIMKVMADPQQDVREAFKEVISSDITVWIYLLGLTLSVVWSSLGNYWVQCNENCNPSNWPLFVAWTGEFYFGFVVIYGLVWYFRAALFGQKPEPPPVEQPAQQSSWFGGWGSGTPAQPEKPPPPPAKKPWCCQSCIKLLACLGIDMMGNVTYFCPAVGEFGDAVLAPASAVALKMLFNSNGIAAVGGTEEILPFTDITPTATIAWILEVCLPRSCVTRCFGMTPAWAKEQPTAAN